MVVVMEVSFDATGTRSISRPIGLAHNCPLLSLYFVFFVECTEETTITRIALSMIFKLDAVLGTPELITLQWPLSSNPKPHARNAS